MINGFVFFKEINPLILDNGIKNVVLNFSNLKSIDEYGINDLYNSYLILTKSSKVSISEIPYNMHQKFQILLKNVKERQDESPLLKRN